MKVIELNENIKVMLREADKIDAANMLVYVNKICLESDNLTFGEGEFEISFEQEEEFIETISKQKNGLFLVVELNGDIIGNLSFIGGKRPRTSHTGEFGVSVLKEYWGKGIGSELIKYLIEWAKNNEIISKINLRVRSDNYGAIHVYEKLGFKVEGTITRDLKIKDKYYDCLHMGLEID